MPQLKAGPIELPHEPLVRALAQRCVDNRKARQPLSEVVRATFANADGVTRVMAVKLAEGILKTALA